MDLRCHCWWCLCRCICLIKCCFNYRCNCTLSEEEERLLDCNNEPEMKENTDKNAGNKRENKVNEPINKNKNYTVEDDSCVGKNSKEKCEIDLVVVLPLSEAVRGFCKAFEQKFTNVRLREVPLNHFIDDRNRNNLVIVICNIVTRTLEDVSATLDKINQDMYQRVFLIALHCVHPKHVVAEAADEVRQDFPLIKETVDIYYFRKDYIEGLHECDSNEKAMDIIKRRIDAGDFAKVKHSDA